MRRRRPLEGVRERGTSAQRPCRRRRPLRPERAALALCRARPRAEPEACAHQLDGACGGVDGPTTKQYLCTLALPITTYVYDGPSITRSLSFNAPLRKRTRLTRGVTLHRVPHLTHSPISPVTATQSLSRAPTRVASPTPSLGSCSLVQTRPHLPPPHPLCLS